MDVADLLSEDGEAKSVKDIEKALLDAEEVPVRDEPKRAAVRVQRSNSSPWTIRGDAAPDGPRRSHERPCGPAAAAPRCECESAAAVPP